ncbi:cyclin-dependent kinase G-2-like [Rosa rugosa]|uniref:cyclin-dependent kinase G-2-like n=1 Tax=Rosa rugosa TaxID=74645 RepID=UPI002B4091E9|nr:cyclin-dependent kinase G-2-like [Rosa rugosa]
MATGQVDVLRRRDSPKYSRREFGYYKNGFSGVKLSHGRHDGGKFRDEVRDSRRWRGQSNVSESLVETRKTPEKKRKFSPVIWDREEKKLVRVSSKNGAVPVSVVSRSSPLKRSSRSPSSEVHDVVSEGVDRVQLLPERKRKSPFTSTREEKRVRISSKNRFVIVSDGVVSNSPASQTQSHGVEGSEDKPSVADGLVEISQMEAPADLQVRRHSKVQNNLDDKDQTSISLSRWASDTDSPRDDVSCSSTTESGEIRREGSVADWSRTSSSVSGDGGEEISGHVGNAGVDQLYPDSDDENIARIEEPAVPRGRSANMLQGCRSSQEYYTSDQEALGEGTYGVVYRARDEQTGEIVAMKKVKMDKCDEGFPITSLREINILLSCNHPSIVGVKEVVVDKDDDILMVMEYMDYELKFLMESMEQRFSIGEVKYLVKRLLEGVKYLHDNWVLHRDLKTSNMLLNKEGELKICDLGLSRQYGSPLKPYTSNVVTLLYRAPELLLGQKQYSTAIDMWSVGCIMAELLAKEPLFSPKTPTEVHQLDAIFDTLGAPNETDWPGVSKLPVFKAIKIKKGENNLRKKFCGTRFTGSPMLTASGLDLLTKLLTYDPEKRITVDDALSHDWFKDYPEPSPFKPSPSVHDSYILKQQWERQRQERKREESERRRREKRH